MSTQYLERSPEDFLAALRHASVFCNPSTQICQREDMSNPREPGTRTSESNYQRGILLMHRDGCCSRPMDSCRRHNYRNLYCMLALVRQILWIDRVPYNSQPQLGVPHFLDQNSHMGPPWG